MRLPLVLVFAALTGAGVFGQVPVTPVPSTPSTGAGAWTTPRTAFGHPDLEGTWENNSATPLERPQALADKPFLTDTEMALMLKRQQERFSPEADAVFGDSLYLELLREKIAATESLARTVQSGSSGSMKTAVTTLLSNLSAIDNQLAKLQL